MRQTEVGAAGFSVDQGRSRCPDIGAYLLGSGVIGPDIWVRYMGPDTAYAEGAGLIPP